MNRLLTGLKWAVVLLFLATGMGTSGNGGCGPPEGESAGERQRGFGEAAANAGTAEGAARRCNHADVAEAARQSRALANAAVAYRQEADGMDKQIDRLLRTYERNDTKGNLAALQAAEEKQKNLKQASANAVRDSKKAAAEAIRLADLHCGPTGHSH